MITTKFLFSALSYRNEQNSELSIIDTYADFMDSRESELPGLSPWGEPRDVRAFEH